MATLTPNELATQLGSTGREVRKFLRSITPRDEQPGKGSRWSIAGDKRSVQKLSKQFRDWNAKQLEERAARAAEKAAEAASEVEPDETPED